MKQKKILVVDDDPEMRLALSIRLRANNYEVCVAVDGVSAVSEARRQLPDLILLDLGIPAGDGFSVLDRLMAMESLCHIPVIVVSGRNRLANQERVLAARAQAFLQKPVKNSQLLAAVEKVLGPKNGAEHTATIYDLGKPLATTI